MDAKGCGFTTVVKVGGSLFDLPGLGPRLQKWLAQHADGEILLVPGGGSLAEVIREYDRLHALGEERAHWLALSALAVNARFLASLLPAAVVIPDVQRLAAGLLPGGIPILDPCAFARADEGRPGPLPHCWTVTSDSLAARAARRAGAKRLILLKSVSLPAGTGWTEAAQRGLVDAYFPGAIGGLPAVEFINFRDWPAT
jgi:aspartokinase-like uncharacterized kinase